jgi:outer membrane protein assembly factor BamB
VFSFDPGVPLAGPPGIAADGSLVAGTVDGYLYALRPDGSFRWSYTLRGRVVGRPGVGSDGLILASAQRNALYALEAEGTLRWVASIPGGVTSAPVTDGDGKIWVTTGGGTLLGFTRRGGVSGFARIGPASALGPVLLESGEVAVGNADGTLRVAGRYGRSRLAQCEAPLRELRAGSEGLFALGAAGLASFDASPLEERWVRAGVSAIACTRPVLVAIEHGLVRWLSAAGEPGPALPLPPGTVDATTCLADGSLLLTTGSGALHKLSANGERSDTAIPPGGVLGLDLAPTGLVIVSYRDGRIVGIEPPA